MPAACDPGFYGPYVGAKDDSDCNECLPGYYCPGENAEEALVECEAGYFCPRGSKTLNIEADNPVSLSNAGKYAPVGSAIDLDCERGYYQEQEQQETCVACPAGYFCEAAGLDNKPVCEQGYYCPSYVSFLSTESDDYDAEVLAGSTAATALYSDSSVPVTGYYPYEGYTYRKYPCPAGTYDDDANGLTA